MYCIIPCRSGSKRVPNKALLSINGEPMLKTAIQKVKKLNYIKEVYVSTDDHQYGIFAEEFGATFLSRSIELSDDYIGVDEALGHVVRQLSSSNLITSEEYILTLFPCSPLLSFKSLAEFCKNVLEGGFNSGLIVSKYPHPIQRSLSRNSEGLMRIDNSKAFNQRTQDLETKYHDAGQAYITKSSLLKQGLLIDDLPYGYVDNDVIDIDNQSDLEFARSLLEKA